MPTGRADFLGDVLPPPGRDRKSKFPFPPVQATGRKLTSHRGKENEKMDASDLVGITGKLSWKEAEAETIV